PDQGRAALAALYEFWKAPPMPEAAPERSLVSTTLVPRDSPGARAAIHDREPVILARETWDAWPHPATSAAEALSILATDPPELAARPVGAAVGRVSENGPELLERAEVD